MLEPKRKGTNLENGSSLSRKHMILISTIFVFVKLFKASILVSKLFKKRHLWQSNIQKLSGNRERQNTMKTRWFSVVFAVLFAVLLFDICSCAVLPKNTALKLKDVRAEETKALGNGALVGESDNLAKEQNTDEDEEDGGKEDVEDFDEEDEDEVADGGEADVDDFDEEDEDDGEGDVDDFDEENEGEVVDDDDEENVDEENEDADDSEDTNDGWTDNEDEDYDDEDEDEGDNGVDDEHADEENNEYDDDEDRLMDEEYAIDDEEDGHDVSKQLSNVSEDDDDSPEEPAITEKTLELANADRKGILTLLQCEIIE